MFVFDNIAGIALEALLSVFFSLSVTPGGSATVSCKTVLTVRMSFADKVWLSRVNFSLFAEEMFGS